MNLIFFHNWYYSSAECGEKQAIEAIEFIGVSRNDDRTTMIPKFGTLQECLENSYRGAYTLHKVIRYEG